MGEQVMKIKDLYQKMPPLLPANNPGPCRQAGKLFSGQLFGQWGALAARKRGRSLFWGQEYLKKWMLGLCGKVEKTS